MCTCVHLSMSLRACFSASACRHIWVCPFMCLCLCLYAAIALCIFYVSVRVTFRRSKRSTFRRSKRSTFWRSKQTPDLNNGYIMEHNLNTCSGSILDMITNLPMFFHFAVMIPFTKSLQFIQVNIHHVIFCAHYLYSLLLSELWWHAFIHCRWFGCLDDFGAPYSWITPKPFSWTRIQYSMVFGELGCHEWHQNHLG